MSLKGCLGGTRHPKPTEIYWLFLLPRHYTDIGIEKLQGQSCLPARILFTGSFGSSDFSTILANITANLDKLCKVDQGSKVGKHALKVPTLTKPEGGQQLLRFNDETDRKTAIARERITTKS